MHKEILSEDQLALLDSISNVADFPFVLAGGTALALQLGHRKSIDFDFFTADSFNVDEWHRRLSKESKSFRPTQQASGTLHAIWEGVRVSFFAFPFPWIGTQVKSPWGIDLAGMKDISAMKLEAIAGRGSRKDFIDLYFLAKDIFSLEEIFGYFEEKYGSTNFEPYHRIRSLTCFEDAENEPMPVMLQAEDWSEIKSYFRSEVKRIWGSKF